MKNILMLLLVTIAVVKADFYRIMGTDDSPIAPKINVFSSDTTMVVVRTEIFGYNKCDTTIDNKTFNKISFPDGFVDNDSTHIGIPQIPYIIVSIAVPDTCSIDIAVNSSSRQDLENYLLYPIPRSVFDDTEGIVYSKEIYTYDTTFYETDTTYPGIFYEIKSDGHWRDQRVLELKIYPMQFNPANKIINFYGDMEIKIKYNGSIARNSKGLGPFEGLGRDMLYNYPGIDRTLGPRDEPTVHYYTNLEDPQNIADYIIITHEDFLNNGTTNAWIRFLAQWRVDHNQFDVAVVKVQDIYQQFDPNEPYYVRIKKFLIYAYYNWLAPSMTDGHFAYSLFVGDWDYVATKLVQYQYDNRNWLAGDEFYFADITCDGLPDIMLGRWPVKETKSQDLVTIAQKTIHYEQFPNLGSWRRETFLIAGGNPEGPPNLFNPYLADLKPFISAINYDTIAVRRYDEEHQQNIPPENFCDSIDKYLNAGELITAYFNHGDPKGWDSYDTTNLKHLFNYTHLPFVFSHACLTAMFMWDHPIYTPNHFRPKSDSSFGEMMLIRPDGGTIAFYGASNYAGSFLSHTDMAKKIFWYQNWIVGLFAPPINYGYGWGEGYCCLLGDPAIDLGDYTAYPNLPDLIIRPIPNENTVEGSYKNSEVTFLDPYPYISPGSIVPIRAKIFNIGAQPISNVQVKFRLNQGNEHPFFDQTVQIPGTIMPRDSGFTTAYWNTGITHPDFYGQIDNCTLVVIVDPNNVIAESWEYNNVWKFYEKIILYPYLTGWPKKVSRASQPAIGNIDGDIWGSIEIVYPSTDSVWIFNSDGSVFQSGFWPRPFKNVGCRGVLLADIDLNGMQEIIAYSSESLKVYDYQGNYLPGWPIANPVANCTFFALPALGSVFDPNGYNIIIPAIKEGELKILIFSIDGNLVNPPEGFDVSQYYRDPTSPSIGDLSNDGYDDIIISNGRTTDPPDDDFYYTSIFDRNGFVNSINRGSWTTPAISDLNNDNTLELINGDKMNNIWAYNLSNGYVWIQQIDGNISASPVVGDIHPLYTDNEISLPSEVTGNFMNLTDNFGYDIDPWPLEMNTSMQIAPSIGYIDGDENPDIIFSAKNRNVYAYKYNQNLISPYPLYVFGTISSSPLIGDIDGDCKNEVIVTSADGYIHIWKNYNCIALPQYVMDWPQIHHDYQHTGLYGWVDGSSGGGINPDIFSTSTTVSFNLKKNAHIQVKAYDSNGRKVKTLINNDLPHGNHQITWNGKDDTNALLTNGVYFIEIKITGQKKIMPVRINR